MSNRQSALARAVPLLCGFVLALVLPCGAVRASYSEDPELARKQHASPSGDWILSVDPSNRQGAGAAAYEMRKRGQLQWRATLGYAMWEVAVDDGGHVGGVAYSNGLAGTFREAGQFIVALVDPKGRVLLEERSARVESNYLHDLPHPRSEGVWIDHFQRELVVRVTDPDLTQHNEQWWRYRLQDGKRLGTRVPARPPVEAQSLRSILRVAEVPDTPLTLVQWLRSGSDAACSDNSDTGTQVVAIDADNRVVWTLAQPADLNGTDGDQWTLVERMRGLRSKGAGEFSVQSLARNRWLDFVAIHDPDNETGWRIEARGESAVAAADNPLSVRPLESKPSVPELEADALGVISLLAADDADRAQWIFDFDLDENGAIGWIQRSGCNCDDAHLRWVVHGPDGEPLNSLRLDALGALDDDDIALAALRNGQWLVVASAPNGKPATRALLIDAVSGKITALPALGLDHVAVVAATADGGFVALSATHHTYTTTEQLTRHDAHGQLLWRIEADYADEHALFSPEDVAVLTSGEVVVLEGVSKQVKIFDDSGHHRETLSLEALWGREPNYPSCIAADTDGGFVIEDFDGKPSVLRMRRSGEVHASFDRASYGDGEPFHPMGCFITTHRGELWTSDSKALLRLDAKGRVESAIGALPDASQLADLAGIDVSADGQILAMDDRTHAVHRFDAEGKTLQVLNPALGDYDASFNIYWLARMRDGGVLAERSPSGFVRYDAKGRRVEISQFEEGSDPHTVLPIPGQDRLWMLEFDAVVLADTRGKILKRFERDANGVWLDSVWTAGLAADGSLAVQSAAGADKLVTLLGADGRLIATWPAAAGSSALAFDGSQVVLLLQESEGDKRRVSLAAFDRKGKPLYRLRTAAGESWESAYHVRNQGRSELWLGDSAGNLHRFAWPALPALEASSGSAE